MARPLATKRALRRLATGGGHDGALIRDAVAATDDLDRAAAFVEEEGLAALDRAIERERERGNDHSAAQGEEALAAFEAFRAAARGEAVHFHPGRATALGDAPKGVDR